jgi:heat shock protein HslJ
MSKPLRIAFIVTLLGAVLAVAAYALFAGRAALDGTTWRLTAWPSTSPAAPAYSITATFENGQIGGSSAVNSYGGPYRTGLDGSFSAGPISSTLIAGPEPAMQAEQTYFELLARAKRYDITGTTLTLSDDAGEALLVFTRS